MDLHAVAMDLAYSERDHDLRERIEKALTRAFYAGVQEAARLHTEAQLAALAQQSQGV